MYYYYNAPYFLLVAGLLASLTSGVAFEATLKQSVKDWSQNRSTRTLANLRGLQLLTPFLGMCGGICFFLASGIQIFGFTEWLAYAIALPLTAFTGILVWSQLGRVLTQLQQGGSKALDLDSFS